jgi:GNAT superfamily N-acetyltransferase
VTGVTRVVRATAAERELVLSLVDRLLHELEDRPEEFAGIDRDRVLRHLERAGDRWSAFLARTPDGRSVGVATVMETFALYAGGDYGVIDEMYVDPEHRSRGIGRLIIDAIKEHGRRRGWLRVDVTAPPDRRWERSVKFYESQGFVFTGPKLRFRL